MSTAPLGWHYARRMSTPPRAASRSAKPGQTAPKAGRYRVLVVGDPPTDLSDKVSALHAKAVEHHVQQSRRAGVSQPNPEVQP